jgi:hypothetical protein
MQQNPRQELHSIASKAQVRLCYRRFIANGKKAPLRQTVTRFNRRIDQVACRSRGGGCYSRGIGHNETESQNSHLCCIASVLAGTCALSPAGTSDITTSLCSV